ncbi:MAG: radical SAM family heme chaperone HemW [Bacteroidetes bacterium]|nr:radical SAM family heme chaperone HemW [Bacteroidota bacterium]
MHSLYIHIPYCSQACSYCNFHFSTSKENVDMMINAICTELMLKKKYFDEPFILQSIYLGGGTPSILGPKQIERIFNAIRTNYVLADKAEVTIECNPEDIKAELLKHYQLLGINRLSIGVQSFDDADLIRMNRSHKAAEAIESIQLAASVGFDYITIDLMYGLPFQDEKAWRKNLDLAATLPINHLSCYALTIEERTALAKLIARKQLPQTDEIVYSNHFQQLLQWCEQQQWQQYEISNFCKGDNYAVHNSGYWKGWKYIGIGPSAHSYNGNHRQWNIANNPQYIKLMQTGSPDYFEIELLSEQNKYNEFVMLGLRTKWGVNIINMENTYGKQRVAYFERSISKFISSGEAIYKDGKYILTDTGKLKADFVATECFF